MPRAATLRNELDIDHAIRAICQEAAAALTSSLRSAGPVYRWDELLPGTVARVLELLPTTCEPTAAASVLGAMAGGRRRHGHRDDAD
ncbi:MAG TPA: hypothetical protein VFU43_09465 [Streptosporangiaceae bacterium]|nr:hypothetical protein [Streptosporangiaceae bacterium]